jgi:hypothetical protein
MILHGWDVSPTEAVAIQGCRAFPSSPDYRSASRCGTASHVGIRLWTANAPAGPTPAAGKKASLSA